MLAKLSGSPDKWDTVLEKVEFSINNTVCRSTGKTPSKLLFGVNQTGEVNDKIRQVLESMSSSDRNLDEMRNSTSAKKHCKMPRIQRALPINTNALQWNCRTRSDETLGPTGKILLEITN